jgi:hypothetical protein
MIRWVANTQYLHLWNKTILQKCIFTWNMKLFLSCAGNFPVSKFIYKLVKQFCRQMSKHVSYETIFIWYGIRLQVNVVPQCRNTLQYVVSYVKFLEDVAETKYCSSNEKKIIQMFVEYDTLDRIYKFEDIQMKTSMTQLFIVRHTVDFLLVFS